MNRWYADGSGSLPASRSAGGCEDVSMGDKLIRSGSAAGTGGVPPEGGGEGAGGAAKTASTGPVVVVGVDALEGGDVDAEGSRGDPKAPGRPPLAETGGIGTVGSIDSG